MSGNRCAFPGCNHPLINDAGQFIAETCHIEAAEPGGPRFNPQMTNEERRQKENLLLMCHRHHVETDDITKYSVERMLLIKADHENRSSEALVQIAKSAVEDHTKSESLRLPSSLIRMNEVLGWELNDAQLKETITECLEPGLRDFDVIPVDTRTVFLTLVERGLEYGDDLRCPVHEIAHALKISGQDLHLHLATLQRYGFASVEWERFDDEPPQVETKMMNGWTFWRELKTFCERTEIPVSAFVNEMRFDQLD